MFLAKSNILEVQNTQQKIEIDPKGTQFKFLSYDPYVVLQRSVNQLQLYSPINHHKLTNCFLEFNSS